MKYIKTVFIVSGMLLLVVFFYGDWGVGGSFNQAPVISNLYMTPSSMSIKGGVGTVTVNSTIDFTDAMSDITALRLSASDGTELTAPIGGMTGKTSGTISGNINIPVSIVDAGSFKIWVVDSEGNNSNKLSGNFRMKSVDYDNQWKA
jgi:hypothetical protein